MTTSRRKLKRHTQKRVRNSGRNIRKHNGGGGRQSSIQHDIDTTDLNTLSDIFVKIKGEIESAQSQLSSLDEKISDSQKTLVEIQKQTEKKRRDLEEEQRKFIEEKNDFEKQKNIYTEDNKKKLDVFYNKIVDIVKEHFKTGSMQANKQAFSRGEYTGMSHSHDLGWGHIDDIRLGHYDNKYYIDYDFYTDGSFRNKVLKTKVIELPKLI
jgi:uncharacterized coiled-coil protein SlyX